MTKKLNRRAAETLAAIASMPIRVVFDQFDTPFTADQGGREFHITIIRAFWRRGWIQRGYRRASPDWVKLSHIQDGWRTWEVNLTEAGRAALADA